MRERVAAWVRPTGQTRPFVDGYDDEGDYRVIMQYAEERARSIEIPLIDYMHLGADEHKAIEQRVAASAIAAAEYDNLARVDGVPIRTWWAQPQDTGIGIFVSCWASIEVWPEQSVADEERFATYEPPKPGDEPEWNLRGWSGSASDYLRAHNVRVSFS